MYDNIVRIEFNREPVIDAYACVHEARVRRDTVTRCVRLPEKESVARSERRREKERETVRLLDGSLNRTIDTELDWGTIDADNKGLARRSVC